VQKQNAPVQPNIIGAFSSFPKQSLDFSQLYWFVLWECSSEFDLGEHGNSLQKKKYTFFGPLLDHQGVDLGGWFALWFKRRAVAFQNCKWFFGISSG